MAPTPLTIIDRGRRAAEDAARRHQLAAIAAAKRRELATYPLVPRCK